MWGPGLGGECGGEAGRGWPDGADARAYRKPAARRPVAGGRSAWLRTADRRVQPGAAGRGRRRGPGPLHGGQRPSPAQAAGGGIADAARGAPVCGTRARPARDGRFAQRDQPAARSRGAGTVGPRDRRSGPGRPRAGAAAEAQEGTGAGTRGAARRGRAAQEARHGCARVAAGKRQRPAAHFVLLQRRSGPALGVDPGSSVRRMKRRGVTIVVHSDGDLNTRQYRLPTWAFAAGKWAALVLALLAALFFTLPGPISRAAARVPRPDRERARP